jgi:hypothetical protein
MPFASADELFDEQAMRALAHFVHGGADFGECTTTRRTRRGAGS